MPVLVIAHVIGEEIDLDKYFGDIALRLLEGVYLSWRPVDEVRRVVDRIKRDLVRKWEERGEGPRAEFAVVELSDDQFREFRHIVRSRIEEEGERLLAELERFVERYRGKEVDERGRRIFARLKKRYEYLSNVALAFDVRPSILLKIGDVYRMAQALL